MTLGLLLALAIPANANCLAASQNAIAAVQIADAYTISKYTWQGDPGYDQVLPQCSKTSIREFDCNVAFHLALVQIEDKTVTPKTEKTYCILNYLGAIGYGIYIHHAIEAQIFSVKF